MKQLKKEDMKLVKGGFWENQICQQSLKECEANLPFGELYYVNPCWSNYYQCLGGEFVF
jgi:hypothetical protein